MRVRNSKRVLSWLLTVVMIVGMLPMTALAAEDPHPTMDQLAELGYSFVDGYQITFEGGSSILLNGKVCNSNTTTTVLQHVNNDNENRAFFYVMYGDELRILTVWLSSTGNNPNPTYDELIVAKGWTSSTVQMDSPQSLDDLGVTSEGYIYYDFVQKIQGSGTTRYYLGPEGFQEKTDGLTSVTVKHTVQLVAGANLSMNPSDAQTVNNGTAIVPITVTANSGYELNQDTVDAINADLSGTGLSAKLNDNGTITISGIPTGSVSGVTLPAAAVRGLYVSKNGSDTEGGGDGTQDKPYLTLAKAYKAAADGATIYVMDDLSMTAPVAANERKAVTITGGSLGRDTADGALLTVSAGSVTLKGIAVTDTAEMTLSATGGSVNLNGVTLTGGGYSFGAGATVTATGRIYTGGNTAISGGGTIKRGFGGDSGSGIDLVTVQGGTLTLSNITLDGNKESNSGTLLDVSGGKAVLDSGAVLTNAKTATATGGSGRPNRDIIHVAAEAELEIKSGAEIKNNENTYGTLYTINNEGTVNMSGGAISGNHQASILHNTDEAVFNMSGGAIKDNTIRVAAVSGGSVTLSGAAKITNNKKTDGSPANLLLGAGATVSANGLSSEAQIGVTTEQAPAEGAPVPVTSDAATAGYFTSDAGYGVQTDGDGHVYLGVKAYWVAQGGDDGNGNDGSFDKPFATLSHAYGQLPDVGGAIYVKDDLTLTAGVTFDGTKAVTITTESDGNTANTDTPVTIKRGGEYTDTLLAVSNGSLTLKNITVDGGAKYGDGSDPDHGSGLSTTEVNTGIAATKPMIKVSSGATLNVIDATLEKNSWTGSTSYGGAIYNEGAVTVENSTIQLCQVASQGPAIYSKGGTVTLENSRLERNACTASQGALSLNDSASCTMTGGAISKNYAAYMGAGVYVVNSTFTMESGVISGNVVKAHTTNSRGGGLCINTGTFQMKGGAISGNEATKGGGIYMISGEVILSGSPKITENYSSAGEDSNVYLADNQTVTIGSEHLGENADIGIYTVTAPKDQANGDVKFATGANVTDASCFHSDNAKEAGVLYCSGSEGDGGWHTHESNGDTLWLSTTAKFKPSVGVNPADGSGYLKVDEPKDNYKYAVLDKAGNAIPGMKAYDTSGNELTPDGKGWVSSTGPITFKPIPAGSEVQLVSKTAQDTDTAPNAASDSTPATIPAVDAGQLTGTVAPDGDDDGELADASITIKPADPNLSYAIVDQDGNVVGGADGWKTPTNGSVTFSPLDPNTKYEVVAVPKDTPNKPTSSMAGKGTEITTPAEKKAEADKIDRETNTAGANAGKDKIVIDSTDPTLDYAIVDPATGKVVAPVLDGSGDPDADGWQTGNNGKLTFDGLTPGKPYEVVTRPHVTDGSIPVANQPGVTVGKTGVLEASGIVRDASGPVPNATVKVTVATTDGGYVTIKTTTDANGKYTLKGANILLPSDYTIYVDSGKGVASSTQTFNKNQPQDLSDITVDKAATGNTNIVGGAVSDYGKPVENQQIVVKKKADGSVVTSSTGSVTTTTKGGGYTLEDLPDGTYIVEATTAGGKSGMTEIKVSGGKVVPNEVGGYTNTNIPVTPGGIVSGTVSGLEAGEKAPVTINVPLYNEEGEVIGTKTVTGVAEGPGGYWQIAGVPNGDYPVTVTTPNGVVTGTATVGNNGAVSKVDGSEPASAMTTTGGKLNVTGPTAKPAKPNAITGVVVNKDNEPVENAKVIIYNEQGDKVGEATTGKGGGYTVPNDLPNGSYYISADQGGKNGLTGPVQITNGQTSGKTTVTVSEDTSKLLEGTVTKEGGATKAANATVVVKDSRGNVIATTKTNASGQYFVGSVPAGAEVSIVTPDGETAKFTVADTTPSDGVWDGDATTAKPASGSKPVIGPSGEKLPINLNGNGTTETKITVTGPNPATDNVNGKFTVTDGNLTAKTDGNKPAPGTYTVTVEQNGMKVEKTITVNGEGKISDNNPIVIAPHTVTGTVKYGTGVVPSDASISVPGWGEARVNTTTGKYTLTGIPDGEYKATIKVTDSNKAAPDNESEIEVTLKVENGVASYANPTPDATTGASTTPSGSNLTVTPTNAVNGIAGKVTAAKNAVDAAKSDSSKVTAAIDAVKAAQEAINGATEEELKQLDKNAAQALAGELEKLLTGDLTVKANATGMTNTGEATSALNSQKGLLVEDTELKAAAEAQKTVEVSLALKAEDVTNEPTSAVNKDIPKVEAVASATGAEKTALYEIVVEKTTVVRQEGSPISETTTNVTTLPAPITLTLNIPQNLRGYQYYGVVRVHGGNAERIPSTATASTITITSNLYSTYAILASNDPIFPDDLKVDNGGTPVIPDNPGGNGGNGGGVGGSSSSTTVKVEKTEGGKVTVDKPSASKGDKVTITCKPDSGFEVGSVTVTDKNGNTIKVTDIGNNKYTFTMPDAKPVTVEVEYVRSAGTDYGSCPKDRTCPIAKFTDASPTAWYHDGVHFCVDEGLMAGTSATTFSPNTSTTRGMIVTILYRLEGTPAAGTSSFPDVAAGQYYADAVAWASANGIVTGYTNGNFGPNDPITREQMAAILYRYASYKGYDVSERADLGKFSDRNSVSAYAVEPLSWANAEGLITGMGDGSLNPGGHATRAQVATILMRFCELFAD